MSVIASITLECHRRLPCFTYRQHVPFRFMKELYGDTHPLGRAHGDLCAAIESSLYCSGLALGDNLQGTSNVLAMMIKILYKYTYTYT